MPAAWTATPVPFEDTGYHSEYAGKRAAEKLFEVSS